MFYDAPSRIHGMGIFSTVPIKKGTLIRFGSEWRTKNGFNSSCVPNVSPATTGTDGYQVREALKDVPAGEELTVNYRLFPGECNCGRCSQARSEDQSDKVCHCHEHRK